MPWCPKKMMFIQHITVSAGRPIQSETICPEVLNVPGPTRLPCAERGSVSCSPLTYSCHNNGCGTPRSSDKYLWLSVGG